LSPVWSIRIRFSREATEADPFILHVEFQYNSCRAATEDSRSKLRVLPHSVLLKRPTRIDLTNTRARARARTHTHTHTHTYTRALTHTYINTRTHTHLHFGAHAHKYTRTNTRTHARAHKIFNYNSAIRVQCNLDYSCADYPVCDEGGE